jgi:hypothetical protein
LCVVTLATTAQTYKIQKAWAFVTESMPGRVMQDESGNTINPQPIIQRFIYIETNSKNPITADSVWYNGTLYTTTATLITQAKHQAGIIYTDGKPVFISPKKGNRLWRIDVQPATPQKFTAAATVKKIIVKGKLGNNRFTQTITAETRLNGPEYN